MIISFDSSYSSASIVLSGCPLLLCTNTLFAWKTICPIRCVERVVPVNGALGRLKLDWDSWFSLNLVMFCFSRSSSCSLVICSGLKLKVPPDDGLSSFRGCSLSYLSCMSSYFKRNERSSEPRFSLPGMRFPENFEGESLSGLECLVSLPPAFRAWEP
jgi:hypothetical protein